MTKVNWWDESETDYICCKIGLLISYRMGFEPIEYHKHSYLCLFFKICNNRLFQYELIEKS